MVAIVFGGCKSFQDYVAILISKLNNAGIFVIMEQSGNAVPTLFGRVVDTSMESRMSCETVAYIHCKTTSSKRFQRSESQALMVAAAWIAAHQKMG